MVYACFLDMFKAFERVGHHILLTKVLHEGMFSSLIHLLGQIFSNSKSCASYGDIFSTSWKACLGVRRGGITPTYLFRLYLDVTLCEIDRQSYSCW